MNTAEQRQRSMAFIQFSFSSSIETKNTVTLVQKNYLFVFFLISQSVETRTKHKGKKPNEGLGHYRPTKNLKVQIKNIF